MTDPSPGENPPRFQDKFLWLIIFFKVLHGVLLVAVALGAYHLIDHDLSDLAQRWADAMHVDPDNQYFQAAVDKLNLLSDRQLRALSIGSLFYAALVLTEGIGLGLRKRWAEYFTIAVTGSFLPLEIYEIVHRCTALKIGLLLANLVILGYLAARLRKGK